jgi:SpoVK/Ycf46/Vps4 family AAA+-type ATPase
MISGHPAANPVSSRRSLAPDALETFIRARYPLLYVVSYEEERVLQETARVASSLGKQVYDWSVVQGLARWRGAVHAPIEGKKGTKDPVVALKEIPTINDPAVFILRDFHNFINDSAVKRLLRDLAHFLRSSLSTVVILSPVLRLPEELEKDMTIVDFPLPSREDLTELLEEISRDLATSSHLTMDSSETSLKALVDASVGLTRAEAENVFAKTLVVAGRLSAAEADIVHAEKRQVVRKSGLLEYVDTEESLQTVGGLDRMKAWLRRRKAALDPAARQWGLPNPRGVLLVGVQGCGKSMAAKATATELGHPLLRMDVGSLFSKMVGETELNMRRALALAEAVAPAVLWIDELEKALSGTQGSGNTDGGTTSRVFGTLLTWLQEKDSPVFVVATANDIENLPPEVLRKGRFDEIFFVDLPTVSEREAIFSIHLSRRRRPPSKFDLPTLARVSEGFSGAEIEQAIVEALYDTYGQGPDITTEAVARALQRSVPLSRTMAKAIEARRQWAIGRTVPASSR